MGSSPRLYLPRGMRVRFSEQVKRQRKWWQEVLMHSRCLVHIYRMNEVPELFFFRLADVVTPLWRLSYEDQLKVGT